LDDMRFRNPAMKKFVAHAEPDAVGYWRKMGFKRVRMSGNTTIMEADPRKFKQLLAKRGKIGPKPKPPLPRKKIIEPAKPTTEMGGKELRTHFSKVVDELEKGHVKLKAKKDTLLSGTKQKRLKLEAKKKTAADKAQKQGKSYLDSPDYQEARAALDSIFSEVVHIEGDMRAMAKKKKQVIRSLLKVSSDRRGTFSYRLESSLSKANANKVKKSLGRLEDLVDKDLIGDKFYVQKESDRAFYRHRDKTLDVGSIAGDKSVFHEMGHYIEDSNPAVRKRVRALFKERTEGPGGMRSFPKRHLGGAHSKDEFYREWIDAKTGKKRKWIDKYMGKTYMGGETEILSMGMETMWTDPVLLMKKDPELFELIVDVMRGRIK